MDILTKEGVKKIYYKPSLYPFTFRDGEKSCKIHILYDKTGELKGFLLSDAKQISFTDIDAMYTRLIQEAPPTRLEYIRLEGEYKNIKTTTLKPSAKSGAKKGTTMLYLPSDWVELLGIDDNNSEVYAKMKGNTLIVTRVNK